MRVSVRLIVAVAALLVASLVGGPSPLGRLQSAAALTGNYTNPVIDADAPDPHILKIGSTYYAYTTQVGFTNTPVYSSTNLSSWTFVKDALPNLGSWATWGSTWAPTTVRRTNPFGINYTLLFYTAKHTASGRQCIGRAYSYDAPYGNGPTGPFLDDVGGPIMCQTTQGGSIDPHVYVPNPGGTNPQAYLFWKSDNNAIGGAAKIWSQPFDQYATSFLGGTSPIALMTANTTGWEAGIIEAPALTKDQDGHHIMLFSGGGYWGTGYSTGVAICDAPFGIFNSCTRIFGNPQFLASNSGVKGPGGADVFNDDGGYRWMVYHGYKPGQCSGTSCSGARQMRIDKLCFYQGPRTNGPSTTQKSKVRNPDCLTDVST